MTALAPPIIYKVDDAFEDFDLLDGEFVVCGDDYGKLISAFSRWPGKIVELSYGGAIGGVTELPKCTLEIVLDKIPYGELLPVLYRLSPQKVFFAVTDPSLSLSYVRSLISFPFSLDILATVNDLGMDEISSIIQIYAHDPKCKLMIQPFHAMLESFMKEQNEDLWNWYWMDLEKRICISDGSVGYYGEKGAFVSVGTYSSGEVRYNDAYDNIMDLRKNVYNDNEQCRHCSFFFMCNGLFSCAYGTCDKWKQIFEQMHEVSTDLSRSIK